MQRPRSIISSYNTQLNNYTVSDLPVRCFRAMLTSICITHAADFYVTAFHLHSTAAQILFMFLEAYQVGYIANLTLSLLNSQLHTL